MQAPLLAISYLADEQPFSASICTPQVSLSEYAKCNSPRTLAVWK